MSLVRMTGIIAVAKKEDNMHAIIPAPCISNGKHTADQLKSSMFVMLDEMSSVAHIVSVIDPVIQKQTTQKVKLCKINSLPNMSQIIPPISPAFSPTNAANA